MLQGAYYASPFDKAVVLTVDGVGEWTTSSIGVGSEEQLTIEKEIKFPNSSWVYFTQHLRRIWVSG